MGRPGSSACGNGNYSEEWCANFAAWAWRMAGVSFTYAYTSGDINGAAASFYQWGADHGSWHAAGSGYTPQPGDAVIYGLNSAGTYADHVAIVTSYTSGDAGPNVVNGDWWVSGNGGVVAASDQTTATGRDGISGYVSP
jgi:alkylation response protein AidB-like acyl-CoA dehydrogenase